MLFDCPQYEKERLQLNQMEKEPIRSINDFRNALTCISRTREIASFLKKCHNRRFPQHNIAATKKSMENRSRNKKPSRRIKETEDVKEERIRYIQCSHRISGWTVDNGHAS